MSAPRVHVVLATYEPRRDWLEAQVTSVLGQVGVDVSLHLTDDGSGPTTQALLAAFAERDARCTAEHTDRRGSAANFAGGLARAPRDVSAIMLCDQDDIWEPDKALRSLARLDDGHVLVHGDASVIDAAGAPIAPSLFALEQRSPHAVDQGRLVVRNVVTGCTTAFRPSLLDAALPFPSAVGGAFHHDLWLALCAAGIGSIGVVPGALLRYRQHDANVVGAVTGYGRWRGPRDALGSWALRRHIASTVLETSAGGRLPPPARDVRAWIEARAEVRTFRVLHDMRHDRGMRPLLRTLRAGAMLHLARRCVLAPVARGRRVARLTWRGLRLLTYVVRNPRRMLGGIARNAGIIDQPLRVVTATALDPQLRPLRARITARPRTVNILIPGISPSGVFGGVGTAIALGVLLATAGERTRLVLTDYGQSLDASTIRRLILRHLDVRADILETVEIVHAIHDDAELELGADDVIVATAWWTAFRAEGTITAHPSLRRRSFVYLVQDDETLFYPASERQLLASRSYRLPALHVVNSSPLASHLATAHSLVVPEELVFAPKVAVTAHAPLNAVDDTLRLVVYGRPSVGRNLFDTALRGIAMWDADRRAASDMHRLEIVSVGETEQFRYRIGETMVRSPGVLSWDDYLALLRRSHVGVSMMTSPHPSYPPLEMAACGMTVVTNRWGPKDLSTVSKRLVSCEPDASDVARALATATARQIAGGAPTIDLGTLGRPLEDVAATLLDRLRSEENAPS